MQGVRRFDRSFGGSVHFHTAGGLLERDHAIPEIDYEALVISRACSPQLNRCTSPDPDDARCFRLWRRADGDHRGCQREEPA